MFPVFVYPLTFTCWFFLGPVSDLITKSHKWSSKPVAFVALVRDIFAFPELISYPVTVLKRSKFVAHTITWIKCKKFKWRKGSLPCSTHRIQRTCATSRIHREAHDNNVGENEFTTLRCAHMLIMRIFHPLSTLPYKVLTSRRGKKQLSTTSAVPVPQFKVEQMHTSELS